jgi:hypothetical protein
MKKMGLALVIAFGLAGRAPAGELDPLARMAGTWVTKGTWDDPSKGGIRVENEWSLDGRLMKGKSFLVDEKGEHLVYESTYTWHPAKKKIVFQSYSAGGDLYDGVIEPKGDTLDVTWVGYEGSETHDYRETLRFTGADTFEWNVFVKKGSDWSPIKNATFQRAGSDGRAAKAAFEWLKKLAGTWEGSAGEGDGSEKAVVEYTVSANASVVTETLFPRTGHEMISMYHLVGDDLVMTHYCAMGNQPHMKLDPRASKGDTLVFAFDGGTNFDPKKDGHIHEGSLKFDGGNHLDSSWSFWMNGREAGKKFLSLTRKAR